MLSELVARRKPGTTSCSESLTRLGYTSRGRTPVSIFATVPFKELSYFRYKSTKGSHSLVNVGP